MKLSGKYLDESHLFLIVDDKADQEQTFDNRHEFQEYLKLLGVFEGDVRASFMRDLRVRQGEWVDLIF